MLLHALPPISSLPLRWGGCGWGWTKLILSEFSRPSPWSGRLIISAAGGSGGFSDRLFMSMQPFRESSDERY